MIEAVGSEAAALLLIAVILCICAAVIWLIYLIQLVSNEEAIAERIRQELRRIEEERREIDDKRRQRKFEQQEMIRELTEDGTLGDIMKNAMNADSGKK